LALAGDQGKVARFEVDETSVQIMISVHADEIND
jgi:hypothetical protein